MHAKLFAAQYCTAAFLSVFPSFSYMTACLPHMTEPQEMEVSYRLAKAINREIGLCVDVQKSWCVCICSGRGKKKTALNLLENCCRNGQTPKGRHVCLLAFMLNCRLMCYIKFNVAATAWAILWKSIGSIQIFAFLLQSNVSAYKEWIRFYLFIIEGATLCFCCVLET